MAYGPNTERASHNHTRAKCAENVNGPFGPSSSLTEPSSAIDGDGPYVTVKQVTCTKENTGNLMCVLHVLKAKRKLIMYDYASFFKRQNERDTPSENNTGICLLLVL